MNYSPVCEKAQRYAQMITEDPMSQASGAPVEEILEGWMKRHIQKCKECREASIEASMP